MWFGFNYLFAYQNRRIVSAIYNVILYYYFVQVRACSCNPSGRRDEYPLRITHSSLTLDARRDVRSSDSSVYLGNPWERQSWDSDAPWAIFQDYCFGMNAPRKIERLAKMHPNHQPSLLRAWSYTGRWDDRAALWDAHLNEVRRHAVEDEVESLARRHARLARKVQGVAERELNKLSDQVDKSEGVMRLEPRDVLRYVQVGTAVERGAAAIPEVEKPKEEFDLSKFSLEELRVWRELMIKATGT